MGRSPEAKARRKQRAKQLRFEQRQQARHRQEGKPCTYCARAMTINVPQLYPTKDHVEPRSRGGSLTVWACLTCNAVKRDMSEEAWMIYRAHHDFWWLGGRARKAANWTPRPVVDNLPPCRSETGPEATGIDDALTA